MVTHSLYLVIYYRLLLVSLGCDVLEHLENLIHNLIEWIIVSDLFFFFVLIVIHNGISGVMVRGPGEKAHSLPKTKKRHNSKEYIRVFS